MTSDRETAAAHARAYHEAVYEVSADGFAPDYRVWPWDEMPKENQDLLVQASLTFLNTRYASAEQMAIGLMAMARRMHEMGGTIGEDEHGFRAMGDKLAHWAADARQLGVRYFGDISIEQQSRDMALKNMAAVQGKLGQVREAVTMLEKARSDDPFMAAGPLLTVLADFVERIEGVLNG